MLIRIDIVHGHVSQSTMEDVRKPEKRYPNSSCSCLLKYQRIFPSIIYLWLMWTRVDLGEFMRQWEYLCQSGVKSCLRHTKSSCCIRSIVKDPLPLVARLDAM